jgi:hypothetical protein
MYCEIDLHADMCSFGPDSYIVQDTGQTISDTGFLENLGTVNNVRIITAAVAYDCPDTSQTYILFFHQALYFPKLANNAIVNDTPIIHLPYDQRTPESHSIITGPLHPSMHIPLSLHGTTSYFQVRKPTFHEINNEYDCIHVLLMSDSEWDPYDPSYQKAEESMRASIGQPPVEREHTIGAVNAEQDEDFDLSDLPKLARRFSKRSPKSPPIVTWKQNNSHDVDIAGTDKAFTRFEELNIQSTRVLCHHQSHNVPYHSKLNQAVGHRQSTLQQGYH